MKEKLGARRIAFMLLGNVIVGLGNGVMRKASFGTDPFTLMNLGLCAALGIDFGTFQLLLNILLLAVVFLFGRRHIGLGTVVNMIFIGYLSDFSLYGLNALLGPALSFGARIALMIPAVAVICLGASLYMEADLGISPYDAMAFLLIRLLKGRLSFRMSRILTDIFCVAVGVVLGSVAGVGTLLFAFFTGPLVVFFRQRAAKHALGMQAG
jgi:uncharacterized membrane protein YczE